MKNAVRYSTVLVFALLVVFGASVVGGGAFSSVAWAQEATGVPTVGTQDPVQPAQPVEDNNNFPWGLLGLLGLAGLAGLRRQPEPVRQDSGRVQSTVGVYDNKK